MQFEPDIIAEDLAASEPGYTPASKGWTPLSAMNSHHLRAATEKLARDFPGHPELADMQRELAARDRAFAEMNPQQERTA